MEIRPAGDGASGVTSTLDVHATILDDLPAEREAEEVSTAVHLIHAYREGRAPFFDWSQHMQAAEHHLGSGRYEQTVIAAATATQAMVNIFFREVWEALELKPDRLTGVLGCPFKNQLVDHLPRFLTEPVDLDDGIDRLVAGFATAISFGTAQCTRDTGRPPPRRWTPRPQPEHSPRGLEEA